MLTVMLKKSSEMTYPYPVITENPAGAFLSLKVKMVSSFTFLVFLGSYSSISSPLITS